MSSKFERASEIVVSYKPEEVWQAISNPNNFDQLFIPGMICAKYEASDYLDIAPGSVLTASNGTATSSLHIVEYSPPSAFSFGYAPQDWTFRFLLTPLEGGTSVRFERKFRRTSVLERLVDFVTRDQTDLQKLADTTTRRLQSLLQER